MNKTTIVFNEVKRFFKFILQELKPKEKILTPFNIISLPIMFIGFILLILRFVKGLGFATNLSQEFPWGFWIGFDVITGVAFAGGAYVITLGVYVMKIEKYHPNVKVTIWNDCLPTCVTQARGC